MQNTLSGKRNDNLGRKIQYGRATFHFDPAPASIAEPVRFQSVPAQGSGSRSGFRYKRGHYNFFLLILLETSSKYWTFF